MQAMAPHNEELQQALRYRNLRTLLRTSGLQSLIFGFGALVLGIINRNAHILDIEFIRGLLLSVGVISIIHGLVCLWFTRSFLFLSNIVMSNLLIFTYLVSIPSLFINEWDYKDYLFLIYNGLLYFSLYIVKNAWRRYKYYRIAPKHINPELIDWINTTADTIRKTYRSDRSIIQYIGSQNWFIQLKPDIVILVTVSGNEVLLLDHTSFSISRPTPNPFNKYFGYTVITLDSVQYKGRIRHEMYARYLEWQQSLPQAPNLTWVPRA